MEKKTIVGVTECQLLAPRGEASLTGAKISATRDPLDRLIERGLFETIHDTKHFLYYTPYYVYVYIYCSPVQKILSQHIQQHSTKVHITSKSIETPCTQDTLRRRKKKKRKR